MGNRMDMRRALAVLLAAVLVLGSGIPGIASEVEPTLPRETETSELVVETTVGETAGEEILTEPTAEPTLPPSTETGVPETTEATVPQTTEEPVPETTEESVPQTSEAETIPEETEETLPEETGGCEIMLYGAEERGITRFGSRETPMEATAQNSVATLGSGSGIKFRLFNYTNGKDASGNYITAGGINDNGLDGWFNFRGTSYENTGADGKTVSSFTNSLTDVDGYTANHATVLPNLGSDGYPVFDGSRDGGPQKSLGYLFGGGGRGVTGYAPANTLLRQNSRGQYYYNSADNAVDFDTGGNRFIVRTYRERGRTTATMGSGQYYDFFPFTYWDGTTRADSATGSWYNYENTREVDYWFGMTMEAAFSMPAGGLVEQDQMVFEFSGDDDVWVFIDGVLVLDLGGTHGVVSGSINFATGEVKQYLDWNGTGEGSSGTSYPTTLKARFDAAGKEPSGGWNGDVFANYTQHSIKFYYLERATSCANCKILFNMPILPTGKLTVEKALEGTVTELTAGDDYGFVLLKPDGTGAGNVAFDRVGADGRVLETGLTDSRGYFALKAGQRAEFDLTAGKTYQVREADPGSYAKVLRCSVNGNVQPLPGETEDLVIDPDRPVEAVFVNSLNTTALTVGKRVAGNMGDRDQEFSFRVRLYTGEPGGRGAFISFPAGSGYDVQAGEARFALKHGQQLTLEGIPLGAWAVVTEDLEADYETCYTLSDGEGQGRTARVPGLLDPAEVLYTNTREVTIETGVALDTAPYVWMGAAGLLPLLKRRRKGL